MKKNNNHAESSVGRVGIGGFERGRAHHSVANAANPSQGQDQSVNPVQSAEGLAPCTTNDSISPFVCILVYTCMCYSVF